jgi:sulfatase maturation enzyme AslB (radical SAM superfamily)
MATPLSGSFDGLFGQELHGWAWDPSHPDVRVTVDVFEGPNLVASAPADLFRPDLRDYGIGDGAHAFIVALPPGFLEKDQLHLSFRCREPGFELEKSPFRSSLTVDPSNVQALREQKGWWSVRTLFIEPISACNADCVYCPNVRSGFRLDPSMLKSFLEEQVARLERVQLGCEHEPTTHFGLTSYFELLAGLSRPPREIALVTNGTLLHRHKVKAWAELGLKRLMVSIDTTDPELNKIQRPGTDLVRILQNLKWFRDQAPEVELEILSVVTALNVGRMEDVVDFASSLGVAALRFRAVTYWEDRVPRNPGFPEQFRRLALHPGQFESLRERLLERYPDVKISFD